MGNGCGPQMDGFSAHLEPYGSILDDSHNFNHSAVVSDDDLHIEIAGSECAKQGDYTLTILYCNGV